MKKIIIQIISIITITTNVSFASIYDLEFNTGQSTQEARFNATLPLGQNIFATGIGAIYNDDDYKIGYIKLALGKELLPALRVNLGVKGLWGNIEENRIADDLRAIGLVLEGKYIISKDILPLPVAISADFILAPDSLCFSDSDRYVEFRTSLDFFIVEDGAIVLGYRHINVRLEDNHEMWETSDKMLFIGYQIRY